MHSLFQEPFHAQVVVWCIGKARPNNTFIPPELLDEGGFVRVDPTLRVVGQDSVFCVGDIAATDAGKAHAPPRLDARARPDGRSTCDTQCSKVVTARPPQPPDAAVVRSVHGWRGRRKRPLILRLRLRLAVPCRRRGTVFASLARLRHTTGL